MAQPVEILEANMQRFLDGECNFAMGDMVQKKQGSKWRGQVIGFYSTPKTPYGYAVESAFEEGSVQVWPEAALERWNGI